MRKKNGFTLIELLVVIALMLSILGIAVANLVSVSKKKKEEAWEQVKAQIETAAVEYFTANEYLFEGLSSDSTANAYITVGALVEEDYLDKVTNPVKGSAVSYCTQVKVTKKARKLTAAYDATSESNGDNKIGCSASHIISVREPGAPEFSLKKECSIEGNYGWCRGTETFTLDIKRTNGTITSKKYCTANGSTCNSSENLGSTENSYTDSENGNNRVTKVTVSNQTGSAYYIEKYKIDSIAPDGTITIDKDAQPSSYPLPVYLSSDEPNVKIVAKDALSGVKSVTKNSGNISKDNDGSNIFFFATGEGEFNNDTYTITDVAGNTGTVSKSYVVSGPVSCPSFNAEGEIGDDGSTYVSNINVYATLANSDDTYYANLYGNGNYWLNTSVTGSGLLNTLEADASHKYTGYVTNKYGLSKYCESDTYDKDTTPPACPSFSYDFTTSNGSTGDGRDGLTAGNFGTACPTDAKGNIICKEKIKVKIWADMSNNDIASASWYTNADAGDYVTDVASGNLAITSYWSTWNRASCPYPTVGALTGLDGCGSWPKMLRASNINGGWRQGVLVVTDSAGNSNYCLTPIFKLNVPGSNEKKEETGPSCYSGLSYEGTKGDNGWYKSNITVKKNGNTLCKITSEGTNSKCSYQVSKNGKTKTCYSGGKKLDKTAPQMNITSGPKRGSCSGKKAITTTWTASDNLSGISVEKDYYGFDNTYNWQLSNKLVDRGCSNGTTSCTYTHTWGPYCKSYGTPGSGNNYKLKWYLKDKAGNVNYGMSGSYKW